MEVNFYEMYLEEMALIPVLEAEEEEKVLALAATGDKEAKKRLVEGSLAKVAQMVKEYEGRESFLCLMWYRRQMWPLQQLQQLMTEVSSGRNF